MEYRSNSIDAIYILVCLAKTYISGCRRTNWCWQRKMMEKRRRFLTLSLADVAVQMPFQWIISNEFFAAVLAYISNVGAIVASRPKMTLSIILAKEYLWTRSRRAFVPSARRLPYLSMVSTARRWTCIRRILPPALCSAIWIWARRTFVDVASRYNWRSGEIWTWRCRDLSGICRNQRLWVIYRI